MFLAAGSYVIGDGITRYYGPNNSGSLVNSPQTQRALVAGGGGIMLGLGIIWKSIRWVQTTKPKLQPTADSCPYCGAITEKSDTQCKKCGKHLPN